jgi:hypothetical protein
LEEKETMTLLNPKTKQLETFNIHTGEIVAREGENLPTHLYSIEIADAICNLIREGKTYTMIAAMEAMPALHAIYRWKEVHPDFAKKLKAARKDRATYFHDKAVDILEESDKIDKDEVSRDKFRFDSFLKLAERGAPTEYGQQTQLALGSNAPTMIVINTGINREDPVTFEGEAHVKTSTTSERKLCGPGETSPIGAETSIPGEGSEPESEREVREGIEAEKSSKGIEPNKEEDEEEVIL